MEHSWINADLRLSEIPDKGITVEHNGRSYIAREQTLNSRTIAIFEICVELGFSVAIQKGHPQGNMAVYDNWLPHNDLMFRDGRVGETMKFLREEDGLDIYLDLETNQECFRPQTD